MNDVSGLLEALTVPDSSEITCTCFSRTVTLWNAFSETQTHQGCTLVSFLLCLDIFKAKRSSCSRKLEACILRFAPNSGLCKACRILVLSPQQAFYFVLFYFHFLQSLLKKSRSVSVTAGLCYGPGPSPLCSKLLGETPCLSAIATQIFWTSDTCKIPFTPLHFLCCSPSCLLVTSELKLQE